MCFGEKYSLIYIIFVEIAQKKLIQLPILRTPNATKYWSWNANGSATTTIPIPIPNLVAAETALNAPYNNVFAISTKSYNVVNNNHYNIIEI